MNNDLLLQELAFSRNSLIRVLESLNEQQASRIPEGFNNSVLWNTGHILGAMENFLFRRTNRESSLPESYEELFGRGSTPKGWSTEPPSLQQLIGQLRDQTERVKLTFAERMDEELSSPAQFPGLPALTNVAEMLSFALWHEGQHIGYITAMKHVLNNN